MEGVLYYGDGGCVYKGEEGSGTRVMEGVLPWWWTCITSVMDGVFYYGEEGSGTRVMEGVVLGWWREWY